MNLLSIFAFVLAAGVFLLAALTSTKNPMAYLDGHAALIVFGGTIAVAAISYQLDHIWMMIKVFFRRVLGGHKVNYVTTIQELLVVAEWYRTDIPDINEKVKTIKDHFLRDYMALLVEATMTTEELERILEKKIQSTYLRYMEDARKFKALGKYPPAMGLLGAVLGMISLLQGVGAADAAKTVGVSMSVALVATLYGIAFSNLFVLPIGENLVEATREVHFKNQIIKEGILLIAKKTNPIVLTEELNAFLLPREQVDWRQSKAKK
jgi:chemotaxis protein MotA